MEYDNFITHSIDVYMGRPKSGKTLIAGSYPKPLLYVSVGNDGGGRVLMMNYRNEISQGLIKVKNLKNDPVVGGKIQSTSIEKLAKLLAELRKPGADEFKTIVVDTLGALQDDYKTYMEISKNGKALSQPEWGEVGKMMFNIKDNMKRFSEEKGTIFVWCTHTRELEVYETSGLNKEIRIIPDLTVNTGTKFLKDASNIFYCCRKTVINPDNSRTVRFLTYVGAHPLMDTGSRDIKILYGDFVENFDYNKWQAIVAANDLNAVTTAKVAVIENNENNEMENVEND